MSVTPPLRRSGPIAAVIFDLDGVLVDSEPAHRAASRRLVAPHSLSDEEYARFVGASGHAFMAWIRERFAIEASNEVLGERYSALVVDELMMRPPPALTGAEALLEALRAAGVAIAVASQSQPSWVRGTLDGAGLAPWFEVVVAADAVVRGKPAPDIYLHTAERLGVEPACCLAVEDSVPGVASAVAAGMKVVQTRQASTAVEAQPGAHFVIGSLREFDLGWLEGA